MVQYVIFILLSTSTYFYNIPSTYAATTLLPTGIPSLPTVPTVPNTTVLLTSPKLPSTSKPSVPTTTLKSASLTKTTTAAAAATATAAAAAPTTTTTTAAAAPTTAAPPPPPTTTTAAAPTTTTVAAAAATTTAAAAPTTTTSPQTSTISITVPITKSTPSTTAEPDVKMQDVDATTAALVGGEFDEHLGEELSELIQPQNLGDAVTENGTEAVTSTSTMNTTTTIDNAETTDDAQTSPATMPSSSKTETPESTASSDTETSEPTSSPTTNNSTSGNDRNATTNSDVTTKRTSTSTGSESTPEMTTNKASVEVTKASGGKIETMFGTTGLPVIIGLLAICAFLLIIIIILTIRASKSSRHKPQHADDKSVPKLQLLEIRDDKTKRNNQDDLQTFSLDYEKHVQERIEEHKRKNQAPPKAEKPGVGVSTFMQKKKQSLRSNQSVSSYGSSSAPLSPVSPSSPSSPAELKPLIKQPEDEPVIFNFAKRPSELLTARRTSALDDAGRRRSNASGQKTPKLALPENELFDI